MPDTTPLKVGFKGWITQWVQLKWRRWLAIASVGMAIALGTTSVADGVRTACRPSPNSPNRTMTRPSP